MVNKGLKAINDLLKDPLHNTYKVSLQKSFNDLSKDLLIQNIKYP